MGPPGVAALLDPYCHLEVFLAHVTCHFFSGKSASGTSEEGGNSWEVNASTDSACESGTRKEAFRRELKSRNSKGMACFFPSSFFSSMVVALIRRTVCESAVYLVAGFWNVDAIFTVQWIFFEIGASIGRWLASKTAMRRWHIFFCNIALAPPPELFPRHLSCKRGKSPGPKKPSWYKPVAKFDLAKLHILPA